MFRSKPKDTGIWSLSRIISWSSEKRSNLRQIKAWAKINIKNEEGENGFDAFLILNNNGEGRVEALGPWRAPIFYIVFNPDFVYLYIFNESTLYFGKNRPSDIQRLTGLPLDLLTLFDSLVSNLPEDLSECYVSFLEEGNNSLLYLECEDQGMCFKARIIIRDFPIVEEVSWIRSQIYEDFRVKYFDIGEDDGYILPKVVHFQWPEGRECHISFRAIKINQPVPKGAFKADETWFQGKVITLEGSDY